MYPVFLVPFTISSLAVPSRSLGPAIATILVPLAVRWIIWHFKNVLWNGILVFDYLCRTIGIFKHC